MPLNTGFTYTETLDARQAGRSLLDYLTAAYRHSSEAEWRERIAQGLVRVDGHPAEGTALLRPGQTVTWERPPWEEPEVPLHFEVLFEDADLLAVGKPSGLPTMPAGGFFHHTLLHLVRQRWPEASPIHRLGRGTSGIVLFFLRPEAGTALLAAMREHRVEKVYRTLVEGQPAQDAFTVEVPIGPVPHGTLGFLHAACAGGKPARSHARVLARRQDASLLEVRIETGRPHQIRIHMAAIGHPLVGDPLYVAGGGIRPETRILPGDEGYLLHAQRLRVPHPRTGEPLDLVCEAAEALRIG